jgi:predicted MPP superfamily phosphohydrolase
MRKVILLTLFSLGTIALIIILRGFFPKFHGILTALLFLLLMDVYLWRSVRRSISSLRPLFRYAVVTLYWLPAFTLMVLVVFGMFFSFLQWNLFLRTQLLSLFFITFFAKIIPVLFLLAADGERLLRWSLLKIKGKMAAFTMRRHGMMMAGWILGTLIWLVLLSGMIVWVFDFKVRTVEVPMNDLPQSFNGFRIVQLSDIHLGSWTSKSKLEEAVALVNSLNPDIILFTGDMFNYATADGEGFQPVLEKLKARHGVFSILGNHDYGDYVNWPGESAKQKNMEQLFTWYKQLGWHLLINESVVLHEGPDSIALIGVENWGAEKRFQKRADLAKALAGVNDVPCKILLSHDPTHWDKIISKTYPGIGLTLAGHTHGGQFGIETEGIRWSPVAWVYEHWGGLYKNSHQDTGSDQYLYVNRGLGTVGYSGRVGIRPEISVILLRQ